MSLRASVFFGCAWIVAGCYDPDARPSSSNSSSSGPRVPGLEVPEPVTARQGSIVVSTMGDSGEGTVSASAEFGPETGALGDADGCAIADRSPPPEANRASPSSDSAGDILLEVVLGAELNRLPLDFDPTEKKYGGLHAYTKGPATGTIRAHARGDVVPAFDVEVPALAPVEVLAPTHAATVTPGDLRVAWTYEGEDVPTIVLFTAGPKRVHCVVSRGREQVVPAGLVNEALAAAEGQAVDVTVATIRTNDVIVGDYRVRLSHNVMRVVHLKW